MLSAQGSPNGQPYFVGEAGRVAADILATARRFDADETVVVTWTYDPAVRRRSIDLLAKAFGLGVDPLADRS